MISYSHLSQLERYKLGIASMFKDTILARYDDNGAITRYIRVPTMFSQNGKWFDISRGVHIRNHISNNEIDVSIPLPSMSLTFSNLDPDSDNALNQNFLVCPDNAVYTPTPFVLRFALNIITKRTSDTDQIVEQIIPLFNKQYTINVNMHHTLSIKQEVITELKEVDLNYPEEHTQEELDLIRSTVYFESSVAIYRFPVTPPEELEVEFEVIGTNGVQTDLIIEDLK